ncbi:MAG TPA: hypothetical protein VLT32_08110, partial [Candidatus Sulfomarinibacteraceae bacterium]|nr:hypothetical protein [Candidatus Sulfomarinibacteraceae bacterium]
TIYLPLVMTDSGHHISNGSDDIDAVYRQMIDRALNRSASASMTVRTQRSGSVLRFDVRLTNRSGATLSAANDATVTALIWAAPVDPDAVPVATFGRTAAVPTLADGATGDVTLEVVVGGLDESRTRWVVIADYQPTGTANAYDTLQAVTGP